MIYCEQVNFTKLKCNFELNFNFQKSTVTIISHQSAQLAELVYSSNIRGIPSFRDSKFHARGDHQTSIRLMITSGVRLLSHGNSEIPRVLVLCISNFTYDRRLHDNNMADLHSFFHFHCNQYCRSTHMTPECWYIWRLSDKYEFLHCTRQCLKTHMYTNYSTKGRACVMTKL